MTTFDNRLITGYYVRSMLKFLKTKSYYFEKFNSVKADSKQLKFVPLGLITCTLRLRDKEVQERNYCYRVHRA